MASRPDGTQGYGDTADRLVEQYESRSFAEIHRGLLPWITKDRHTGQVI